MGTRRGPSGNVPRAGCCGWAVLSCCSRCSCSCSAEMARQQKEGPVVCRRQVDVYHRNGREYLDNAVWGLRHIRTALNRAWLAGDVPDTFVPFRTDPAGGVANGSPFPKRTTGRRGPVAVFANPCVTDVRKLRAPAMRIEQPAPFPHMPSFHFSDASRSSIAFSASIALYPNADLQAYSRSNGRSAAAPCFFR